MIIKRPTARKLDGQTIKSDEMSMTVTIPKQRNGSGDKWLAKTDFNCEINWGTLDNTPEHKSRTFQIWHTFKHFLSLHTQEHKLSIVDSCLEYNSNLNLQGINYIRSRSTQCSYINAKQLFKSATVITPVIILLRVYLRGPAAEWCITCRLRNHQRFHHTFTLEQRSWCAQVW